MGKKETEGLLNFGCSKNRKAYIPYDIWLLTNYPPSSNCLVGLGEKKEMNKTTWQNRYDLV